jgi:hypothetical protein
MSIVCFSSDSRTPPSRPSIVGRMPILGSELLKADEFFINRVGLFLQLVRRLSLLFHKTNVHCGNQVDYPPKTLLAAGRQGYMLDAQ